MLADPDPAFSVHHGSSLTCRYSASLVSSIHAVTGSVPPSPSCCSCLHSSSTSRSIVAAVALALGVSAWFGTRYSALGRPWPYVRKLLHIGPPRELEVEWPPRFAQAIGFLVLGSASILFLAGLPTLAWLFTGAVAVLQTVLAATGYCLGCRLYFLSWKAPILFRRLAR